jgi:hypothetical protein
MKVQGYELSVMLGVFHLRHAPPMQKMKNDVELGLKKAYAVSYPEAS